MGSCVADDADFGVEHDAVFLVDALLDFVDEAADVGGGGVAGGVDDEAGVFGGDLGAADLEALEACLLDQCAGEVAFGALEGAAGARHLEGLLALAALGEVVHLGADGAAVAGLEAELDFDDGLAVVLEAAVAST